MHLLIADDHPIFRSGLQSLLLTAFPDATITALDNGKEAKEYIAKNQPTIAILDIDMPEKNGLEVTLELAADVPTRFIILTMYNDAEMLRKALSNGASGYLVKDNTSDELVSCIETVLSGDKYVAKSLRKSKEIQAELQKNAEIINRLETLTQTELKTLKLVSEKYSSKEIADLLFVSTKSVENYRSRICKKLELDARNNSLLIWVLENKTLLTDFEQSK